MSVPQGLSAAANHIASYGRGPDTGLAHMSPDEMAMIDHLQGGRRTNPHTGLPEYGLFGDIMKALVRVGASVGGFMVGGPAGAAAGSGLATKLTGGSWNDALKGAALSGIGGELGQGLTGGGWNPTGSGVAGGATGVAAGAAAPGAATNAASNLAAASAPAIVPQTGLAGLGTAAMSTPGIAAGLGSLSTPLQNVASAPLPQVPTDNFKLPPVQALNRSQTPYMGDPTMYGQSGQGGEHRFFDDINPQPRMLADGGPPMSGPLGPPQGIPAGMPQGTPQGGPMGMSPQIMQMLQAHMQQGGPQMQGGQAGAPPQGMPGPSPQFMQAMQARMGQMHPQMGPPQGMPQMAPGMAPQGNFGPSVQQMRQSFMNRMHPQQQPQGFAIGGNVGTPPMPMTPQLMQAASLGYGLQMADGGTAQGHVSGPGGPKDDKIPAMLSNGEHVSTAHEINSLGFGSNSLGQKRMYRVREVMKHNPQKILNAISARPGGTLGSMSKAAA